MLLEPVEMHRGEQVGRWLELVELLFDEQCVRTQRDEFLSRHDAFDDGADVLVNERLAARNGYHRGAAFIDRGQAPIDRQAPVEVRVRIIDLAASNAGEIAAEQRFEHQHRRIAFAAKCLLLEHTSQSSFP
jgi:hypothetical protein